MFCIYRTLYMEHSLYRTATKLMLRSLQVTGEFVKANGTNHPAEVVLHDCIPRIAYSA